MLRDLLVLLDQAERADIRLRMAVDLACRHRCKLTALFVRERTPEQMHQVRAAELALASCDELDQLKRRIERTIDCAEQQLRSTLERLRRQCGVSAEWRSVNGFAATAVPDRARYADLAIVAWDEITEDSSVDHRFGERLLFVTVRPVLFIPDCNSPTALGRHVAVAWNSTRVATRAVNDALPLIERAEHTTVITVNPVSMMRRAVVSSDHILEHLRWHTDSVESIQLNSIPHRSVAHALQDTARSIGADLIVAGAFGHPRFWEGLVGGVTHDLLGSMKVPMFMSH